MNECVEFAKAHKGAKVRDKHDGFEGVIVGYSNVGFLDVLIQLTSRTAGHSRDGSITRMFKAHVDKTRHNFLWMSSGDLVILEEAKAKPKQEENKMNVKEFAEKNAGKKFKFKIDPYTHTGTIVGYRPSGDALLVLDKTFGYGHNASIEGSPERVILEGYEVVPKRMFYVSPDSLTPIDTPSEPRKGSKKARKIERAGEVLKESLLDIENVYTGFRREDGKLQTIVVLKNGKKGIVVKSEDDKFDPYVAVLEARKKALKNHRRFL